MKTGSMPPLAAVTTRLSSNSLQIKFRTNSHSEKSSCPEDYLHEPETPIFPALGKRASLLGKRLHSLKTSEEREMRSANTDENTNDSSNLMPTHSHFQHLKAKVDNFGGEVQTSKVLQRHSAQLADPKSSSISASESPCKILRSPEHPPCYE